MKPAPTIAILALIALALLALLFWYARGGNRPGAPPNQNERLVKVAPGAGAQGPRVNMLQATAQPSTSRGGEKPEDEKLSSALEGMNVTVEFWGKVVDQDEHPLSGVRVTTKLRHWQGALSLASASRFINSQAQTGSDGMFYIGGETGDTLSIEAMEKAGYELEPAAKRSFGYNTSEQFRADPNLPVLFRMWQTNMHEPLLAGRKSFHIQPDGRAYIIDLHRGALAEPGEGDLRVSVKHATEMTRSQTMNWSSEISVTNGGILEETNANSSMYLAPTNGYSTSFLYEQQIQSGRRGSMRSKRFFLMLNGGREYGRIVVEIFAPYNERIPGLVRIDYAINPSGSRVLR